MSTPQEKLDAMLKDFESRTKTDKENPGQKLRDLLDKSPDLKQRILDSIDKGNLEKFSPLPAGIGAGGTYNGGSKTIELPMHYLNKADKDKGAASELIFVMGHEIQHSFNRNASVKTLETFTKQVEAIAKGPSPHNYTEAVRGYIDSYRKNEASAHIGGYNAIVSQVQKDKPKAALEDFYNAHPGRMGDFIERSGTAPKFSYALKAGLSVDKNQHMPETKENVEAMGKYYFGKKKTPGNGFGPDKDQDYTNYYGDNALKRIDTIEKRVQAEAKKADPKAVAPAIQVDLKSLGLDKAVLNTGLPYTDAASKKHPIEASVEPESNKRQRGETSQRLSVEGAPTLYAQAVTALEKLGPDSGIKSREELGAVAAAMAVKAQGDGLSRIDSVVKSTNGQGLIALQGEVTAIDTVRSYIDKGEAAQQAQSQNLALLRQNQPQGQDLTAQQGGPQR